MSSALPALHLGALHPVEQALTLLLAFGPFAVLGAVILVRRHQDREEELRERPGEDGVESQDDR